MDFEKNIQLLSYTDQKHDFARCICRKIPQTNQSKKRANLRQRYFTPTIKRFIIQLLYLTSLHFCHFGECVDTPVFILRVACAWVSEFRLFPTYICLLETKEIHSLLCIKFSKVFSNVYDKTCSVVIMQPNQDGSKLHCKLIRQRARCTTF